MSISKFFTTLAIVLALASGCSKPDANENAKTGSPGAANGSRTEEKDSHGEALHWSYAGETGPEHWADLDSEWVIAREGREQSPINIAKPIEEDLPPIEFNYHPSRVNIINNGHTIQVNYDAGSSVKVDGETYQLQQFHFHAPSEHKIDGKSSEMEMHLVHKSAQGELAVVGVLINSGAANEAFEPVWKNLPTSAGDEQHYEDQVSTADLLPDSRSYFTYPGSLTTPPCSEGVKWLLLTTPIELSADQVARFAKIYGANNRPVQPLHDRRVAESR